MSEVIRYTLAACNGYAAAFPVTDGQSIHDVEELGTVMVMASDYASAQSELAALREELAEWKARCGRRVADIGIVVNDKLDLQQRLTTAEQQNSDLIDLIRKAHTWVDRNNFGGWDAYELRDQLAAALQPTESGASE